MKRSGNPVITSTISIPMTDYSYQFVKEKSEQMGVTEVEYIQLLIMEKHDSKYGN